MNKTRKPAKKSTYSYYKITYHSSTDVLYAYEDGRDSMVDRCSELRSMGYKIINVERIFPNDSGS